MGRGKGDEGELHGFHTRGLGLVLSIALFGFFPCPLGSATERLFGRDPFPPGSPAGKAGPSQITIRARPNRALAGIFGGGGKLDRSCFWWVFSWFCGQRI